MKARFRQALRRWRCWLESKRWKLERLFRRPPAPVAALDPLIAQAIRAHKPRRHIEAERTRRAHDALRRGIAQ